jgi:UDP-N-acetylmuramoyl-tripeptide--D-alanyl-D-alanine ligase
LIVDALTLTELADMSQGTLRAGTPSRTVRRISKDTRTLVAGDLYLALRGENHDGNVYANEAAAKGAAGAILDAVPDGLPADFPIIAVDDTLLALHRLAAAWRDRLALRVVCITGSSGKTSTKEFTAASPSITALSRPRET